MTEFTVAETIKRLLPTLTPAEKKLASCWLTNYPFSALGSITTIADATSVSAPTVARMVKKLGFDGFAEFQAKLRSELEETVTTPISKHERWVNDAPKTHILNRFADATLDNLRQTVKQLNVDEFNRIAKLLANKRNKVHIVGGRITHALARYFFTHLQIIRSDVILLPSNASEIPHYVLNMKKGDTLIIFDIRRYENNLIRLAESVHEKDLNIVLFTDQWASPVSHHAKHTILSRVEVPSAWDSNLALLFVVESLIAAVQNITWDSCRERMQSLEAMINDSKLFHKSK